MLNVCVLRRWIFTELFGRSTFDLSSLVNVKAKMTRFGLKFIKKSEKNSFLDSDNGGS